MKTGVQRCPGSDMLGTLKPPQDSQGPTMLWGTAWQVRTWPRNAESQPVRAGPNTLRPLRPAYLEGLLVDLLHGQPPIFCEQLGNRGSSDQAQEHREQVLRAGSLSQTSCPGPLSMGHWLRTRHPYGRTRRASVGHAQYVLASAGDHLPGYSGISYRPVRRKLVFGFVLVFFQFPLRLKQGPSHLSL